MFAQVRESKIRIVRFVLLAGWSFLLLMCVVDIGQFQITDPTSAYAIDGFVGKPIELRGEVFAPIAYNPATRFFWGVAIPLVVLILIFLGHDIWRRICPLSAVSQIPRRLGFQIKIGRGKRRKIAMMDPNGFWANNAIMIQFGLFCAAIILRLTFLSAHPILLFFFTVFVFVIAFCVGLIFGGKTWCHYFCPMNVVQLAISGPRALNADRPMPAGISQSMCRKGGNDGADVSICVGCNTPCPDVDVERNYWDRVTSVQRRLAIYGYLGVVFGFIHSIYAATGDLSYGAAVWYDSDWLAMGFAPFGDYIAVPRWLGNIVLVVTWVVLAWCMGILTEGAFRKLYSGKFTETQSIEMSCHHTVMIFSFVALLSLIYFVALPGMGWLPDTIVWGVGVATTAVLSMWVYRSWFRDSGRYHRESLAHSLRNQLKRLKNNWDVYLNGRTLEQLSTDEIHLVSDLTSTLESSSRLSFYESFLNDAISQGTADTIEGRRVFENLRKSCGISLDEHRLIVDRLKGEFEIDDTLLISANLRLNAFKAQLERLLFNEISAGKNLENALESNLEKIESLRQNLSLTSEEEERVLMEMGSTTGTIARILEDLIHQISNISQFYDVLGTSYSELCLAEYLSGEFKKVLGECDALLSGIEAQEQRQTLIERLAIASGDLLTDENLHVIASEDIQHTLIKAHRKIVAVESRSAKSLEFVLKELSKITLPHMQLVVARAAQLHGFSWGDSLMDKAKNTLDLFWGEDGLASARMMLKLKPFAQESIIRDTEISGGRSEENDWAANLPEASRRHFRIYIDHETIFLEDLNSANGTLVDSRLVKGQTIEMTSGANIRLSNDSNPAKFTTVSIPTENPCNVIDRFVFLRNSRKFNMFSDEQVMNLTAASKVSCSLVGVKGLETAADVVCLMINHYFDGSHSSKGRVRQDCLLVDVEQITDLENISLIRDNVVCFYWEKSVLQPYFSQLAFYTEYLEDKLKVYTEV